MMKSAPDYISKNKTAWNAKTKYHLDSEFYDMKSFLDGKNSLKEIELNLLGDVNEKSVVHLQCHFGQDSLSLARMGAKVTGVDFSDQAICQAKELNTKLNLDAQFICSDLYDLPNQLNEKFDLVFTSYGTIGWLPDLDRWVSIIAHLLKPGGQFIMADFHPFVWMMDANFTKIQYPYFNVEDIIETETGTYANRDAPIQNETISWNHSTSELLNSLIKNGLTINVFDEFDYSPYPCFNTMEEFESGKFRIKHLGNKIPMVYAIKATKI